MKLVIFVGLFKTGSTTLQRTLARNYLSLLKQGVLYPSVESLGLAHNLATTLKRKDAPVEGLSLNITEPHNALALRMLNEEGGNPVPAYYPNLPRSFQMFEAIDNQISALRPDVTVLCAEVFTLFSHQKNRSSLRRLAKRFAGHDVTLYCILRRPDDYLSSWHRQRLKFGGAIKALRSGALNGYLNSPHVQHDQMLTAWQKFFPDARLVIRPYDEVRQNGGTVRDFLSHAAQRRLRGLRDVADQNPSVPAAFAEIGRRALIDLPADQSREMVQWLLRFARDVPRVPDAEVEFFGPEARAKLVQTYAPIHDTVGEMAGRSPFFGEFDGLSRLRPVSDIEAAQQALPNLRQFGRACSLGPEHQTWLDGLEL